MDNDRHDEVVEGRRDDGKKQDKRGEWRYLDGTERMVFHSITYWRDSLLPEEHIASEK